MRMLFTFLCGLVFAFPVFAIDAAGRINHGEEITTDLPDELHRLNTTSRGQGCCTWTSLHHAALYQNVPAFLEAPKWIQEKGIPGGAGPSDWSEYLPKMAKERGYPVPEFVQHTGGDVEFLKLALKTGRYVCVTYNGRDGVFYMGPINHMVNLVHLSNEWAVIHDNNYPQKYLWMTPDQFLSRWRGSGGGWAAVLLAPPPPPIPTTKENAMNALVMASVLMVPGQCSNGSCSIPQIHSPPPVQQYHGWYQTDDKSAVELWWKGEYIGVLNPSSGYWQTKGNDHWVPLQSLKINGEAIPFKSVAKPSPQCICKEGQCKCQRCPEGCVARNLVINVNSNDAPDVLPYASDPKPGGVKQEQIQGNSYSKNGKICTRDQAFFAIAQSGLVDDRNKAFLTIVGDEGMRKTVLADLDRSPVLAPWKGKLHVSAYDLDDWHVKQIGLQPGITFQTAQKDSNVVPVEFRFRAYAGDIALADAIRKVDPNYRPDKDPDPTKVPAPAPGPTPAPATPTEPSAISSWIPFLLVFVFCSVIIGGALLYSRKNQTKGG